MPNGLFMSYNRGGRRRRYHLAWRGRSAAEPIRSFSLCSCSLSVFCSIAFCCRVSRRLALFRGSSVYVRQHLRPVFLFCASKRTEIGICPPPCSLVSYPCPSRAVTSCSFICLLVIISLYSCVCVYLCRRLFVFSVCWAVSLCDPRSRVIGSLS